MLCLALRSTETQKILYPELETVPVQSKSDILPQIHSIPGKVVNYGCK